MKMFRLVEVYCNKLDAELAMEKCHSITEEKNDYADYVNSLYDINQIKNQLICLHKKFDELQEEINCEVIRGLNENDILRRYIYIFNQFIIFC